MRLDPHFAAPGFDFFDFIPRTFRLNDLYVLLPNGRMYVLLCSAGDEGVRGMLFRRGSRGTLAGPVVAGV